MQEADNGRLRLQDTELFRGLDADDLAHVANLGRVRRIKDGETIFSLGEAAREFYVVASGQVALTLPLPVGGSYRVINVQEMDAGHMLGWSALVAPNKYTFGARAVADAVLLAFQATDLAELFHVYPRIQRTVVTNLTSVIASRLTQVQAILLRDLQRRLTEGQA